MNCGAYRLDGYVMRDDRRWGRTVNAARQKEDSPGMEHQLKLAIKALRFDVKRRTAMASRMMPKNLRSR